jgi:hypothetical protein
MQRTGRHLTLSTIALFAVALCATSASATCGSRQQAIELMLARPATANEAVWLQVRVGMLPRGGRLRILTAAGDLVGTVAPFGARGGQGGTYILPLPKAAVAEGRVQLCLEAQEADAPARAPRPGEVDAVELIHLPVTH